MSIQSVSSAPQVEVVAERIALRHRLVRVHVALHQADDVVDGLPQLGAQRRRPRADGGLVLGTKTRPLFGST
jgi:hypothetical protein